MYILLLSYIAARLSDACLDPTQCFQITAEETCLQSRDSRAGYLNQPCTWCHGGACTGNNGNRCEPVEWLFQRSDQINPGDYEIASIGLEPRPCYPIQDKALCLKSKDSRAGYLDEPCVWCDGGPCTTKNGNRCEPAGWLFQRSNQLNADDYEVAVACGGYSDCLTGRPCYQITEEEECLHSKDSRAEYLNQPCTWCHGGACTGINDNRCEPAEWLFARRDDQINPDAYEVASIGLEARVCYQIGLDKALCLKSKDTSDDLAYIGDLNDPCVWCGGGYCANTGDTFPYVCQPSSWLFGPRSLLAPDHYEVAVACSGNPAAQNIFESYMDGRDVTTGVGSKYITFNLSNRAILNGLMYLVGILVVVNVVFLCYSKTRRQRDAYGLVKIDDSDDGDTESPMLQ